MPHLQNLKEDRNPGLATLLFHLPPQAKAQSIPEMVLYVEDPRTDSMEECSSMGEEIEENPP